MDGDKLYQTYDNIARSDFLRITSSCDIMLKKLSFQLTGTMARRWCEYPGNKNAYWDPSANISVTANTWKGGNLRWITIWQSRYFGSKPNPQLSSNANVLETIIRMSQSFGHGIQAQLSIFNPFVKYRHEVENTVSADFERHSEVWTQGRRVSLSLTYRFGRFNDYIKFVRRSTRNTDRSVE